MKIEIKSSEKSESLVSDVISVDTSVNISDLKEFRIENVSMNDLSI